MKKVILEEEHYILAKKKVKKIKGFYRHLLFYILINLCISGTMIFKMIGEGKESIASVLTNFGVYATWIFWGIGLFFHILEVFGYENLFSKKWEEEKIQELMKKEEEKKAKFF